MSAPIVLGFDGSECSVAALKETIAVAHALRAPVVVCFAYYISPLGGGDVRDYKAALEKVAEHETTRALADLEDAGIEASVRHVQGKPAEGLLALASEVGAQMIVVGGLESHSVIERVLGSVVLNLVQRSPVPVLVVPSP